MPELEFNLDVVYAAFILGNVLFVVLVYRILKCGKSSPKEFEKEVWYEDQSKD